MHMHAYNLRASCDYMIPNCRRPERELVCVHCKEDTHHAHWDAIEPMGVDCNELRRRIVEFEDITQDALTGFDMLYGADWSQDYNCESTVKYLMETINRARRFEAYVRDSCQMRLGWLSVMKSRESIELSEGQVKEGKRGELRIHPYRKLSLTGLSRDMYELHGWHDTCALMQPSHSTCLYLHTPQPCELDIWHEHTAAQ